MRALDHPRVYDLIQKSLGRWHVTAGHLRDALADASGERVLDVGAGTGNLAALLPPDAEYIAIDNDPERIRSIERKVPGVHCIVGSALDISLEDRGVDWSVCMGLAHHLEDEDVPLLIAELARVTRKRLVFAEPVWPGKRLINALLWRYDRGSHPRPESTLLLALEKHFTVDRVERFWPSQEVMLYTGCPKGAHSLTAKNSFSRSMGEMLGNTSQHHS